MAPNMSHHVCPVRPYARTEVQIPGLTAAVHGTTGVRPCR